MSDPLAQLMVTTLSSIGYLITSKMRVPNSGISSQNKTHLCANDICPGFGIFLPPANPVCEIVLCGAWNGRVLMVDEPKSDRNIAGENQEGIYQQRAISDGRLFRIVKVYYDLWEIELELLKPGFKKDSSMIGKPFFYLCVSRTM